MKSVGAMIKQIAGLLGTTDVTAWENQFIASVAVRTNGGDDTRHLTDKQLDQVERIWREHFAG